MANYIRILDTTLRDGEQAPGAAMTHDEKLAIARRLSLLGVDVIEAGFPASSPEEFETVRSIAMEVGTRPNEDGHVPVIAAVARCKKSDMDVAWEAVRGAARPRICMFLATSEIHMKHKLRMSKEEVMATAREMVAYAKRTLGCHDITFVPEDGGRSEREFLYAVLGEVIKAGATTVTIPDTVGYNFPSEYRQLIADIKSNTPGIDGVVIGAHCHNDLGLATANSLAAIAGGARQVEVTVNGIGERAGNAALEEVVMAIKCRKELLGGLETRINTKHILSISKMVAEYSGLHVQQHKAIVGANAFSHESGIHQDGILKFRGTYEIISPEDIGLSPSNGSGIVLGKLSGRHAIKARLLKLGYDINGEELDDIFSRFKEVVKKKKRITDDDIETLVCGGALESQPMWSLGDIQVVHGSIGFSTATVKLIGLDGKERVACSVGEDPIDAAYKAINSIIQVPVKLVEYMNSTEKKIHAIHAASRVVICEDNGNVLLQNQSNTTCPTFSGNEETGDTISSSVQAYINAVNKMLAFKQKKATPVSNGKI